MPAPRNPASRGTSTQNGQVTYDLNPGADLLVRSDLQVRKAALGQSTSRGPIADLYQEIGTSGLKQYGGFVLEEWLNQLAGRKAAWAYREMMDNDPTIGSILYAIRWLARGVEWRVEEGNDPAAAEFVEQCMHDMSHTWGDFISDSLSMLGYGWAYPEIVYKRRQGEQPDKPVDTTASRSGPYTSEDDSNPASSSYNDGKIGWRKLPGRAQETLLRWGFDGYSGIAYMEQLDWHGGMHRIPIEKALLLRTQTTRNNPEGRSILRNAYTSYIALRNIKQIEAIGIERDLAGIPMMTPPDGVNLLAAGNAALYEKVQQVVTGIRRDEYEGVILPTAGWKFELLRGGGARQIDTDQVVRRYRQDIATSMLADFVLIGQDAVGSFAMVDVKSDLFGMALDGILDLICEVVNRYAIPRLLKLNGMDTSEPPEIHHGSAGRINLERVGTFLFQLAGSGAPIPWSTALLESLFTEAGLPANFQESSTDTQLVPVGPPKLPPGEDPYAREPHTEPASAQSQADDAAAKTKEPAGDGKVAKADDGSDTMPSKRPGLPRLAGALHDRQNLLTGHLDRELTSVLGELGEQAATAYLSVATKANSPSVQMLHRLVGKVLARLNVQRWIQTRLMPILRNHAARTLADTQRLIQAEIQLELNAGDRTAQRIMATAGQSLGMADIEPQIRQAILNAIRQGLANGDNPAATARRIRDLVPAGVFVHAGPGYRSQLIARTETARMQFASTLALYDSNPNITAVRLHDGIYGPPRSCPACLERDGTEIQRGNWHTISLKHPSCTLAVLPVVHGQIPTRIPEPAAA